MQCLWHCFTQREAGKSTISHDLTGNDPMLYHLLSLLVLYNSQRPCQTTPINSYDHAGFPHLYSLDTFNLYHTFHKKKTNLCSYFINVFPHNFPIHKKRVKKLLLSLISFNPKLWMWALVAEQWDEEFGNGSVGHGKRFNCYVRTQGF